MLLTNFLFPLVPVLLAESLVSRFLERTAKDNTNADLSDPIESPSIKSNTYGNGIVARSPVLTDQEKYLVLDLTMKEQKKKLDPLWKESRQLKKDQDMIFERFRRHHKNQLSNHEQILWGEWLKYKVERTRVEEQMAKKHFSPFFDKIRKTDPRTRMAMEGVLRPQMLGPQTMRRLERSTSAPTVPGDIRLSRAGGAPPRLKEPSEPLSRTKSAQASIKPIQKISKTLPTQRRRPSIARQPTKRRKIAAKRIVRWDPSTSA